MSDQLEIEVAISASSSPTKRPRDIRDDSSFKSKSSSSSTSASHPNATPSNACISRGGQLHPNPGKNEEGSATGAGGVSIIDASTVSSRPLYHNHNHNRTINLAGVLVAQIVIGTLPMGVTYPDPFLRPEKEVCMNIIREATLISPHAYTLFDTADWYCEGPDDKGYMENLLAEAFAAAEPPAFSSLGAGGGCQSIDHDSTLPPLKGLIATKGGMMRIGPFSNQWRPIDMENIGIDPKPLIEDSFSRLGEQMFIWQLHHCSPKNDAISGVMRSVHNLCNESTSSKLGRVPKNVGICNATLEQIIQARKVCPSIVSIQNKFNHWLGPKAFRDELEIIEYCKLNGLVYMAYNVFGGLNARRKEVSLEEDFEEPFYKLAASKRVSPYGLLLAWLISRWPNTVMPIVGMRKVDRLAAVREAYALQLLPEELDLISNMKKKGKPKK